MIEAPTIDWAGFSPFLATGAGGVLVLLAGLLPGRVTRRVVVPGLTLLAFAALVIFTFVFGDENVALLSGALRLDELTNVLNLLFAAAGATTVVLAYRSRAADEAGHGEFHALLLFCTFGMSVLVAAENLVTLFLGFELLSIPLYVLCATEMKRTSSLESGLKYLIVGSVGSATLLYGLAMLYGATGSTDFGAMNAAIAAGDLATDPLLLTGIGLTAVGFAFKASIAPFHQWTPDVYEGAPTPVTAFMAVATKAAAFGVFLRLFDGALPGAGDSWGPFLAALATITIIVGNVGALGQSSLKRLLAWSSVAQAGYLLAGVVVGTTLGMRATVFYLAVYLVMNLAAFAVVVARERETALGDDIDSVAGIGVTRPLLAWPLTIAMLSLAGLPATAGFVGKITLINALVDGGYAWLAIVLVVGSMISLAYYLKVIAAMWMRPAPDEARSLAARGPATGPGGSRPAMAGASVDGEPARGSNIEVALVAVFYGVLTVVLGIVPGGLFDLIDGVGAGFNSIF